MLRETFAVTQAHWKLHHTADSVSAPTVLYIFHCNYDYLVPFPRYSTSNNGMPLKSLGVIHGH